MTSNWFHGNLKLGLSTSSSNLWFRKYNVGFFCSFEKILSNFIFVSFFATFSNSENKKTLISSLTFWDNNILPIYVVLAIKHLSYGCLFFFRYGS